MQQISDWLEKLGLSEYAQRFAENHIDFTILPDLTDQDLEKIGVASLGHRRKLLSAITDLEAGEKSAAAIAVAAPAAPQLLETAERRQVTVMFSDLVGSTALSARRVCAISVRPSTPTARFIRSSVRWNVRLDCYTTIRPSRNSTSSMLCSRRLRPRSRTSHSLPRRFRCRTMAGIPPSN